MTGLPEALAFLCSMQGSHFCHTCCKSTSGHRSPASEEDSLRGAGEVQTLVGHDSLHACSGADSQDDWGPEVREKLCQSLQVWMERWQVGDFGEPAHGLKGFRQMLPLTLGSVCQMFASAGFQAFPYPQLRLHP